MIRYVIRIIRYLDDEGEPKTGVYAGPVLPSVDQKITVKHNGENVSAMVAEIQFQEINAIMVPIVNAIEIEDD